MSITAAGGAIVTFYSYKGGVGRTMALANVAVQLARKGSRVLMVDWDLEAPGLINYFISEEAQQKANVSVTPAEDDGGLLGLLKDASKQANGMVESSAWRRKIAGLSVPPDPSTYSNPTPPTPGSLDLLASGYGRENYSTMLADFSWKEFFANEHRAKWLESLREDWSESYDFVLLILDKLSNRSHIHSMGFPRHGCSHEQSARPCGTGSATLRGRAFAATWCEAAGGGAAAQSESHVGLALGAGAGERAQSVAQDTAHRATAAADRRQEEAIGRRARSRRLGARICHRSVDSRAGRQAHREAQWQTVFAIGRVAAAQGTELLLPAAERSRQEAR